MVNTLVVFGSRRIQDSSGEYAELVPKFDLLDALSYVHDVPFDSIISGGAHGVDSAAERWARHKDKAFQLFLPDWDEYGKAAGFRRNAEMADVATHGICVWDGKSRGTGHMLDQMRRRGKPVAVYIVGVQ